MKLKLTVLLSIVFCSGYSQQWRNYTSSLTVTCITPYMDTVWVGSEGGVTKYLIDGTKLANYTHADGLAHNQVNGIAIDSFANVWFATGPYTYNGNWGGGVSKFDGVNWTTYLPSNSGLPSDYVTGVLIDKYNNAWFTTYNAGIVKFDGVNWTLYNNTNSNLPANNFKSLTVDVNGDVWVICSGQLAKYNGSSWTLLQPVNNSSINLGAANTLAFDKQNNLYVSYITTFPGTNPGLLKFDGSTWTTYSNQTSGYCIGSGYFIIDAQNHLLFPKSGGLCGFDGTNWSSEFIVLGLYASCMAIDRNGNKWFGTSSGVGRHDGSSFLSFNPSNSGITRNQISDIVADRHGNKWIGVSNGAARLVKFNETEWSNMPSLTFGSWSNDNAICIAADNTDKIWIAGEQDYTVYTFDGNSISGVRNQPRQPYLVNDIAFDSQNRKWFSGTYGIYVYDGVSWTAYDSLNSPLSNVGVNAIAIDAQDNKWVCTNMGVYKFDGTNWASYNPINTSLPSFKVYDVCIDMHGNKWFGTNKGVVKYDNANWITYDTTNSGIAGNEVYAITSDKKGYVWLASRSPVTYSYKGVSMFDGVTWYTYNTQNSGLSDNFVGAITVDNLNNKWFATGGGVSELLSTDSVYKVWLQYSGSICDSGTVTLTPVVYYGTPPYTYSWQAVGSSLSCNTCQTPTAEVTQDALFIVTVTDANNVSTADTLNMYACINTALKEVDEKSIAVYPNPTNDRLFIQSNEPLVSVDVLNVSGICNSYQPSIQSGSVDVSILPAGLYIIQVRTKNTVVCKQFLKL